MNTTTRIYINNDLDVVTARMQARQFAKQMGFSTADQARISLAASELARVLSWHTNEPGEMIMSDASGKNGHAGVQVVCVIHTKYVGADEDSADADEISIPRRSFAGACQLVDESIVEEQEGNQARVTLIKWMA